MKFRLLFSMLLCSFLFAGVSQAQSIGIIGSATPTGWDSDTDMQQSPDSAHLWSLVIDLNVGEVKFRQDDSWDTNWGAADFPAGIGTQGGANIPIPGGGQFTVTFNSQTGAYKLSVNTDIGIIGDATPFGWDEDTNMFQDSFDNNKYYTTLRLVQGEAKFRANDAWDINWGSTDFPTGIGTQGGSNIPVAATSKYYITFDKSTGAYSFEEILEYNTIGLIGSGTPGGWDTDTELTKDNANPNIWKANIELTDGFAKFRANNAWTISWGALDFPTGVGTLGGPDIPVTAGLYEVTFNTENFQYSFLPIVYYQTVGILGDGTSAGWDNADIDMTQDPVDRAVWRLRVVLTDGEVKFRADDDWAVNWGSAEFPVGVGELDGVNIPVQAGEYKITFNTTTGAYNFEKLVVFGTIGIIGTATPGAWTTDTDMNKDAVDEAIWHITMDLVDGEAKFRAEDAWAINWGAAQWPVGVGTQDGPNIPVTGGNYAITINTATGDYSFLPAVSTVDLLSAISIVLSPNPVADRLTIQLNAEELKGDVNVKIFNSIGVQVISQTLNIQDRAGIDVSRLVAGNYFVQVGNSKFAVGKSVIVVR